MTRGGVTCRDGVERLMDYLEGVLDPGQREALDRHVAECLRCVAFIESYLATPGIVRAATAAALPAAGRAALRAFLAARR